MIAVWHANDSIFRHSIGFRSDGRFNKKTALFYLAKGGYTKVADVDTDELDVAYKLTNHIESAWDDTMRMTGAGEVFGGSHRSSSIGDIFKLDAKIFVIATVGFEEL